MISLGAVHPSGAFAVKGVMSSEDGVHERGCQRRDGWRQESTLFVMLGSSRWTSQKKVDWPDANVLCYTLAGAGFIAFVTVIDRKSVV